MTKMWEGPLQKIDDYHWKIPEDYKPGMRVPGIIFASEALLKDIARDQAIEQVANVAMLPGIVKYSLAMPDIHWGYGFPIGGVAATDIETGVVSPGGIGYDINCGVRLVRTNLLLEDLQPQLELLIQTLFEDVPTGVGSRGHIQAPPSQMEALLTQGAQWAIEKGYGWPEDLARIEEEGALEGADPGKVSHPAMERGKNQLGTLGSGNHFLEVQCVDEIYDEATARELRLEKGSVTMMIHSGSRGLGYQVCEDNLRMMGQALGKYNIQIPDRQLVCTPVQSPEGKAYLGAMRAAANFAWANRQCLMHLTRLAFAKVFGKDPRRLGMDLIYDVAHNIAKFEKHKVNDAEKTLCVHRKGATRAFPPNHPEIPKAYQKLGQPVIIPGDMGRNSYLLIGAPASMTETFGTTCHGAGRVLSRSGAKKDERSRSLARELKDRGIIVKVRGRETLAEEAPYAYKDVNEVVDVVHQVGISKKVCRMRPLGVVKG